MHIQKWNIPLNEFFRNTEIENFYTIILKSAAGWIEPLSGPHLARGPYRTSKRAASGPRAVVCPSLSYVNDARSHEPEA